MSSSKKERMVYDSGRDRLSELPSSIIRGILSSVSTRDVVRMSILSRQFRDKWIGLPHLVFDLSEFGSKDCMEKFVTNVLKLHKGPIHKFRMSTFTGIYAVMEQSWPIVDEWLLFLPRNEIRELILTLPCEGTRWHEVRSIVYSCNRLTHLELHDCKLGPPPLTFTGFLFLRCLILVYVIISLNDVESTVSRSPLIDTLKLEYCGGYDPSLELRISAPNLKHLRLVSRTDDCMEIYLCTPLLTEICVTMNDEDNAIYDYLQLQQSGSVCNYTNILGGCTSLEKLRGDSCFTEVLSFGIDSCQDSFVLHRLKVIELDFVNFYDVKQMSVVARLVTDSPNLQMLKIRFNNLLGSDDEDEGDTSHVSYMDLFRVPNFKWEKLTIITIKDFEGLPSEIKFLELLLQNSPALERMTLRPAYGLDSDDVKDLREELLNCDVASPTFTLCTDRIGA